VQIVSESVIRFHLAEPLTVHTSETHSDEPPATGLQTR
jgi:hypothetical protein